MRIHYLRHTCATLLLAQDVHPKAVQSILGHSQISLTMDTYSTLVPSVSRQAAEQMDVVLELDAGIGCQNGCQTAFSSERHHQNARFCSGFW